MGKKNQANWGAGEVGGVQTGADGQEYVRDGGWFVLKSIVDQYGGSADNVPVDVLQANRVKYQKFVTQNRVKDVNAWNDVNWDPIAQQHGYANWKEMRRALAASPQFQNASPADQEYLWKAGPGEWAASGGVGPKGGAAATPPPPPTTNRPEQPKPPGAGTPTTNTPQMPGQTGPGPNSPVAQPHVGPALAPGASGTGSPYPGSNNGRPGEEPRPTTPPQPGPPQQGGGGANPSPSETPPAGGPVGRSASGSGSPYPGLGGAGAPAAASTSTGQQSATTPPAPGAQQPGRPSGPINPGLGATQPGEGGGGGMAPGLGATPAAPVATPAAQPATPAPAASPAVAPPATPPVPASPSPYPQGAAAAAPSTTPAAPRSPYPSAPPPPPRTLTMPPAFAGISGVQMPQLQPGTPFFDPFTGKFL